MEILRLVILGGVGLVEVLHLVRAIKPRAPGIPKRTKEHDLGWWIGFLAALGTKLFLIGAAYVGRPWAFVALACLVGIRGLRPAKDFGKGAAEGLSPDALPSKSVARAVGGAAFLILAGIPVAILGTAPGVSRAWLTFWVVLCIGVWSLGGRIIRRAALPELWEDDDLGSLAGVLDHLLAATPGATLSVSHAQRRLVGFQLELRHADGRSRIQFVLWDDRRSYDELSKAVEEIGSAGFFMEGGASVGGDTLRERCRVILEGSRDEQVEAAGALTALVRNAFAVPESGTYRYTLSANYATDLALYRPEEPSTK